VASEIVKRQIHGGGRREIYHFRDEQGLEVDFVVPGRSSRVTLIECKAGRTVMPAMAASLRRLAEAFSRKGKGAVESLLVHEAPVRGGRVAAVAPGVRAIDWREL
jgi:predicted AAA+ superfamily ATPase